MNRLALSFFLLFFIGQVFSQNTYHSDLEKLLPKDELFPFGVASGDPQTDGVVIWTKTNPQMGNTTLEWIVARDSSMEKVVRAGVVETTSERAFTAKVFVDKLQPGRTYYYCFFIGKNVSPIGRTKTAPEGEVEKIRLGVVSCSDFRSGHFNAYGDLARRKDIDAVLHLGDYIYEYGNRKWGPKRQRKTQIREHIPNHTLHSLEDYRTRYGQYRLDPQLMECHRMHPFITVWDDHEIANDLNASFPDAQREAAALQAYFEWLPVRDNPDQSIVRNFTFGNLAELWMLDTRLEGRSPQVRNLDDPNRQSEERSMLGEEQVKWLTDGMANTEAQWKLIGNQVLFSHLHHSKVFNRTPGAHMDKWEGYPVERRRLFDFFYQNEIENIVVLTGDIHTSWSFDLVADPLDSDSYNRKTGKGVIGAEFITPSVTSFNFDEVVPGILATFARYRFCRKKHNPHLNYLDLTRHGYLVLTLTENEARSDWYFVKTKAEVSEKMGRHRSRKVEAR